MRKYFIVLTLSLFGLSLVLAAPSKNVSKAPVKASKLYKPRVEPTNSNYTSPNVGLETKSYEYNYNRNFTPTKVDDSKNGYGMIASQTHPFYVGPEGMFFTYRQWAGDTGTSGQIGASYSDDGSAWTTYYNLNASGEIWGCDPEDVNYGGCGVGRYPSALGTGEYPFAVWNEYTASVGSEYFGGRPYYTFDEFGWDGGSFANPTDVDVTYTQTKDLWVSSPGHSVDSQGINHFNVAYSDWTRTGVYVFHSEYYEDGYILFGSEIPVIRELQHLASDVSGEGSYTSQANLACNKTGTCYVGVTAYFAGAADCPATSDISNNHTFIFKGSFDHGATWEGSGGGQDNYYFIGNEVIDHMFETGLFPTTWEDPDNCPESEDYVFDELFMTYDFDLQVDSDGNPHIVVGVLPANCDEELQEGYVFPSVDYASGWYHFTIDKDYLANPGEPQTATGWNYSFVASELDSWGWTDAAGSSFWQITMPSLSISSENDDVMYVVSSSVTEGPETDPDNDPCTADSIYPEWSQDIYVSKSIDGGATWGCNINASNTPYDDPTGESLVSPEEISAHAASSADNAGVWLNYQMPDYEYGSTTGDAGDADMKQGVYVARAEIADPSADDDCGDQGGGDDCADAGDVNADGTVNILDIVAIVNNILGSGELAEACAADYNSDGTVNILDIVAIVNSILGGKTADDATSLKITNDNGVALMSANGYVGAVQMTIEHDLNAAVELTESALVSRSNTEGGTLTEVIIVAPSSNELFSVEGGFEIVEASAANSQSFIDVNTSKSFALVSSYPNPFNPQTTVSYEISSAGNVDLSVYNIMGQKIATLKSGYAEAGQHSIVWNGLDANGVDVSSGIYFLQLNAGSEVATEKITLLR